MSGTVKFLLREVGGREGAEWRRLYPRLKVFSPQSDSWGQILAKAWGCSRLLRLLRLYNVNILGLKQLPSYRSMHCCQKGKKFNKKKCNKNYKPIMAEYINSFANVFIFLISMQSIQEQLFSNVIKIAV